MLNISIIGYDGQLQQQLVGKLEHLNYSICINHLNSNFPLNNLNDFDLLMIELNDSNSSNMCNILSNLHSAYSLGVINLYTNNKIIKSAIITPNNTANKIIPTLYKPNFSITAPALIKYILNLSHDINQVKLTQVITNYMQQMGLYRNISGFDYFVKGVSLKINNFDKQWSATKDLYPKIAYHFNNTSINVERNMRHLLDVSFYACKKTKLFNQLFQTQEITKGFKPKNSEFIKVLAEKIIFDLQLTH